MKYEIEIPDGFLPANCVGLEWRGPNAGESYLFGIDGKIAVAQVSFSLSRFVLILAPDTSWWPEWLTCEWVVMDEEGDWWMCEVDANLKDDEWVFEGGLNCNCNHRRLQFITIPFPAIPRDQWRNTKMRNPHKEKP